MMINNDGTPNYNDDFASHYVLKERVNMAQQHELMLGLRTSKGEPNLACYG